VKNSSEKITILALSGHPVRERFGLFHIARFAAASEVSS
jgi:hypothetical protein